MFRLPKNIFLFPFVSVLTIEFFSKELLNGGVTQETYMLITRILYITTFLLLGLVLWQHKQLGKK